MSTANPLPEIREADASPDVAAVYAALNEGIGIAQVNLIWRHAAALPGVLDWLWAQAAPALASGAGAAARDGIAGAIVLPPRPAMMLREELHAISPVIETYNRGNLTNLAMLSAIALRHEGVAAGPPAMPAPRGAMLPALPSLPRLAELSGDTQATIRRLTAAHGLSDPAVVPSLYLHLAHWPAFLAQLPAMLAPLAEDAGLVRLRDSAVQAAEAAAPGLIAALGPAPAPPAALADFLPRLRVFAREVIPGMVPVGLFLRRAIG